MISILVVAGSSVFVLNFEAEFPAYIQYDEPVSNVGCLPSASDYSIYIYIYTAATAPGTIYNLITVLVRYRCRCVSFEWTPQVACAGACSASRYHYPYVHRVGLVDPRRNPFCRLQAYIYIYIYICRYFRLSGSRLDSTARPLLVHLLVFFFFSVVHLNDARYTHIQ